MSSVLHNIELKPRATGWWRDPLQYRRTHARAHVSVGIYVCDHKPTHTHTHTRTHTQAHTHTHTPTHTNISEHYNLNDSGKRRHKVALTYTMQHSIKCKTYLAFSTARIYVYTVGLTQVFADIAFYYLLYF